MLRRRHLHRSIPVFVALAFAVTACSSSGDGTTDEAATNTEAPPAESSTTESTVDEDETTSETVMLGDKSIMLDGFVGIVIPAGWSITSSETPTLSDTAGSETELDSDALVQALVINPDDSPRGATFSLVHYEHSDLVPSMELFDPAIVELLSGDGSVVGEGSEVTIGGQSGVLHEVKSASGANGVLVVFESGGEYFFILSLAADPAYAEDVADMLTSVSFEPGTLSA